MHFSILVFFGFAAISLADLIQIKVTDFNGHEHGYLRAVVRADETARFTVMQTASTFLHFNNILKDSQDPTALHVGFENCYLTLGANSLPEAFYFNETGDLMTQKTFWMCKYVDDVREMPLKFRFVVLAAEEPNWSCKKIMLLRVQVSEYVMLQAVTKDRESAGFLAPLFVTDEGHAMAVYPDGAALNYRGKTLTKLWLGLAESGVALLNGYLAFTNQVPPWEVEFGPDNFLHLETTLWACKVEIEEETLEPYTLIHFGAQPMERCEEVDIRKISVSGNQVVSSSAWV